MSYPSHLTSLTRLRFFAAIWVVVYHWREPWTVDVDSLTQLFAMGRFGVDLFFILSGFVLTHVYAEAREQGRFSFGRFLIARFARIWPLHIAVIGLLACVGLVASVVGVPFDRELFNVSDLPANILMVHAWGFVPEVSWNGPSWSISAEWFAYLAFPAYLMASIALRRRPWLLLLISIALFFILDRVHLWMFAETLPMATERFGVIRIIPEFLMGVALYRLGQSHTLPPAFARLSLALVLVIYFLAAHIGVDDRLVALLGAPMIFLLAELDRHAGETKSGLFVYLGDISYTIYMIHVPFFMVAFNLLQDVLGVLDQAMPTLVFVSLGTVMIGASAVSHELFEKPARQLIRKVGDHWIGAG
ncbi:acyltransferase [Maricaulis sp.]|uniref:acyltransferase family protein n=1 Tax=Maricaulis sp. TaxID=1486257 RepID=UPI0025C13C33|nr:acyltransferase [Maricaulis sp.]